MRRMFAAWVALAAGVFFASAAPSGSVPARAPAATVDLKPGQEVTFPVAVAEGRVTLGAVRASKPGTAQPKDGEITVSFVKHGLSPYADLTATEKIPDPVDFVATGLIGDIKIDEVVICGRLDAPGSNRIAAGSWRVSLNRFSARQGGPEAQAKTEEVLGCPK